MYSTDDLNRAGTAQSHRASHIDWPKDVLSDIAAAMRRDGFFQTAELVDDALLTLEVEVQRRLKGFEDIKDDSSQVALRVIK